MGAHSQEHTTDVHVIHRWTFADQTARENSADPLTTLGYSSNDLLKVAYQSDDDSMWILTATTPTWTPLGKVATGSIVNADVSASAAIAGTKIDPAFGDQTISSTAVSGIVLEGRNASSDIEFRLRTDDGGQIDVFNDNGSNLVFQVDGSDNGKVFTSGDIEAGGDIQCVNMDATNVSGNGSMLTNVIAAQVAGSVGNGTYTTGIGGTQNGTITITNGVITAIQEAIA